MQAAFPAPVRVGDLAGAVGMDRSSFYDHFKAFTGMAPLLYYKRLRLLEGRRLLVTGAAESAQAAAYRTGYGSASQFSQDYKRAFGAPPVRDAGRLRARDGSEAVG